MEGPAENGITTLSQRSQKIPIDLDYVYNYSSWPAIQNEYHETENPKGIINFGTAVSGLMDNVWLERLNAIPVYEPNYKHFRYYQFWGSDIFRQKLARFMTHFFKPKSPIKFENDTNEPFDLKLESIESVALEQKRLGKNVRALILNNPSNPLGMVWKKELIEGIMKFCQREKIHLIADEMYCMSVFDKSAEFQSTLQIRTDELMDAKLLHDLCLTSFRTGVIHTENKELQLKLMSGSQFQAVPLPVMDMLENIVTDVEWFDKVFVPKNHERLRSCYNKASSFMDALGIATTKTKAGVFFLADFRPYLEPPTRDNCKAFIKTLYKNGVYITPGWEMRAEPGWFRIVFTPYFGKALDEGLMRLRTALHEWQDVSQKVSLNNVSN
ncbi:1-aminocyclopropane-1-carboxylate synthase-like protein 1 [Orchesella cincta]|uniref:1-aminocyclopropane-1-carboxylate synthase-like protein 1 n=1 Tax=Orchesella cincta TaxID=48709 RepID=A0A1D2MIH9_ORCCI|nr:1-aminocyclopropane-1-carboxylate synthase-like protein 1 [Orchesella cincta]